MLKDSLAAPQGGSDKSMTETCSKAQKTDLLYRRALAVLALYGQRLAAISADDEYAGRFEAAASGVTTANWSDADDQATRDAVSQLVTHMAGPADGSKTELKQFIQGAAAPISSLCSGLGSYLDTQVTELATIRKDVDKKSTTKSIRRCGTYENHTICVQDTVVDRLTYAEVFARTAALENSSYQAKSSLQRFCTAHAKLAEVAKADQLGKKESDAAIADAIRAVPQTEAHWDAASAK